MENKYNAIYQELVVEMFRRVGLEKTYDEIKEFAKTSDWFYKYSWTKQEENDFIEWVTKKLMKDLKYKKKQAVKQAHWFIFDIGWKTAN